jgi:membrane-associated protease RseP (regulator of RpoE activity)
VWPVVVGILVVVLGLGLSVGMHELGHMLPAKKFGVRCPQYMIGFGPKLWSRIVGETEYGIKALPFGGFVRMIGMLPPKRPDAKPDGKGFLGQLVADAREDSMAEVGPDDEHRVFFNLSAPKKVVVMAGGIFMNLLLSIALTAASFAIGFTQVTPVISTVAACVPTADGSPCDPATAPAPAAQAGIEAGDRIVEFDGQAVRNWNDLLDSLDALTPPVDSASAAAAIPIVVERGGQHVPLTIVPQEVTRALMDADGQPLRDDAGTIETVTGAFVGLSPTIARESIPMSQVPSAVWQQFTGTVRVVVTLPYQLFNVAHDMLTDTPRASDGVMSVVGIGRAAVDVAGAQGASVLDRVAVMVSLVASLNMALFVFNLIPLLPLDGGHVANAFYEGAKRTIARRRGRPDPGPADVAKMLPVAYVMVILLIGATVLLVLADIVSPVNVFGG